MTATPDSTASSRTGDARPAHRFMPASKIDNYVSERGAKAYFDDHQNKLHRKVSDRRERRILSDFLQRCAPIGDLLDCPSGFGRLLSLCREHAERVTEADFSPSMLALNEDMNGEKASYLRCSALEIPRPDDSFDVAISVRLSHHLDDKQDRLRHIDELCRVARSGVVLTFFSTKSLKDRMRRLRRLWNKKRPKNTLSPDEVRAQFEARGFQVDAMTPLARIGSGHVYVLARRR
ncbi:MAG: class I SAM-dependent methyltransferase [Planctomycetota bacterium]